MCALLVGLRAVAVVAVAEWPAWLLVVVASAGARPVCVCVARARTATVWSRLIMSICRCSGGRFGCVGASSVGAVRCVGGAGVTGTRRSRRNAAG